LTKSDWTSWIAAIGDNQQAAILIAKLYKFLNEGVDRVPFSDIYNAATGQTLGFRARPVMGGLFARALIENPFLESIHMRSNHPSKRYGRVNKCNTE
jgi:hypothetical protein